jgi:hypothetical protein
MYVKKHSKVTEGYKKLIFGFVVVSVLLVVFIFYFSASRAMIKISPVSSTVETDFVIDVASDGGVESANFVQGILFETEVDGQGVGQATGSELLEGNTIGKVTLINKRAESQALVKTTRLLTQDGILLRLNDRVDIPAGSEVEANVYADDPNSFDELVPTTFTIPGLWEGLQTQVYAESKAVIKSTGEAIKVIQELDVKKAKDELTEQLYQKAIDEFKANLPTENYLSLVVSKQVIEEASEAEIGSKQDEFTVSMKIKAVLIALEQNSIVEVAGDRLQEVVPSGQDLLNLSVDKLSYTVQDFDNDNKTAKVKVHVEGESVIKSSNEIFDKEKMVGLSPKGVELYLANFSEIEEVEVILSPFWVKSVPKLQDHISIVIDNPNQ